MTHKNKICTGRGGFSLKRWKEHLDRYGLGGEILTDHADDFCIDGVSCVHESDVFTGFFKFPSHIYQKSKESCAKDDQKYFLISLIREGTAYAEQGKNASSLRKDDCHIRSMSDPFYTAYNETFSSVSLAVSQEAVKQWISSPEDLAALPLQNRSPWGAALAASMRALTETSFDGTIVPPTAVTEQILCLLALTANQTEPLGTSYKKDVLKRLRAHMREHLSDPCFSLQKLAFMVGMPRRTMYAAFATAETSFGKDLALMRLEKARAYLECFCSDGKTIAEIGRMVGYSNTSLFITRFRQMFGMPPAAYRTCRRS